MATWVSDLILLQDFWRPEIRELLRFNEIEFKNISQSTKATVGVNIFGHVSRNRRSNSPLRRARPRRAPKCRQWAMKRSSRERSVWKMKENPPTKRWREKFGTMTFGLIIVWKAERGHVLSPEHQGPNRTATFLRSPFRRPTIWWRLWTASSTMIFNLGKNLGTGWRWLNCMSNRYQGSLYP